MMKWKKIGSTIGTKLDRILDEIILPQLFPNHVPSLHQEEGEDESVIFSENRGEGYVYSFRKREELLQERERRYKERIATMTKRNLAEKLREEVVELQEKLGKGVRLGVSFHDLHGRIPDFEINGARMGWAASTIKVPVMIATFQAMDRGEISLEDELEIDHRLTLEHYDPVSKMEKGTGVTIFDLLRYMIVKSDNEATNMLADYMELETINAACQKLGTKGTMLAHLLVRSDLFGTKVPRLTTEWNPEGSNLTTATDLTILMTAIYTNKAASKRSCDLMQQILEMHGKQGPLSRYLPGKTIIGGKLGYIADFSAGEDLNETAVFNRDYVLTVMCNRLPSQRKKWSGPDDDLALERGYAHLLKDQLQLFHQDHPKMPFQFEVTFSPQWFFNPRTASEVMGTISEMVFDCYYGRKQA